MYSFMVELPDVMRGVSYQVPRCELRSGDCRHVLFVEIRSRQVDVSVHCLQCQEVVYEDSIVDMVADNWAVFFAAVFVELCDWLGAELPDDWASGNVCEVLVRQGAFVEQSLISYSDWNGFDDCPVCSPGLH